MVFKWHVGKRAAAGLALASVVVMSGIDRTGIRG